MNALEESVRRLLAKGLLAPAPPRTADPACEGLVFFREIPPELLQARHRALEVDAQVSEWFLFTDTDDPSWLDVMRGDFGVSVEVLDDEAAVEAVRRRLLG